MPVSTNIFDQLIFKNEEGTEAEFRASHVNVSMPNELSLSAATGRGEEIATKKKPCARRH